MSDDKLVEEILKETSKKQQKEMSGKSHDMLLEELLKDDDSDSDMNIDDINIDEYLKKLNINLDEVTTSQVPSTIKNTSTHILNNNKLDDIYSSGDEDDATIKNPQASDLTSPHLRAEVDKILDTLNIEEHKEELSSSIKEPQAVHPLD